MNKGLQFLKHELSEMLPPTLYFLVVFHCVAFMRSLMAGEYGISLLVSSSATIGALIVGKSILIADALPFFKKFFNRRLIDNVLWRVFLYAIIVLLFQFLEELIPLISKEGSFLTALNHLFGEIRRPQFWATHLFLVVFLSFYCFASAVAEEIGRDKFIELFFAPKSGR